MKKSTSQFAFVPVPAVFRVFATYQTDERKFSLQTVKCYRSDLMQYLVHLASVRHVSTTEDELSASETQAVGNLLEVLQRPLSQMVLSSSAEELKDFFAGLTSSDLGNATISRKVASLRAFFKWATKKLLTATNPAVTLRHRQIKRLVYNRLSIDDLDRLRNAPSDLTWLGDARDRALLGVLIDTGIRVGDLVQLNMSNLDDYVLEFAAYPRPDSLSGPTIAPIMRILSERTMQDMRNYLRLRGGSPAPSDPLFINKKGRRNTPRSVRRMTDKWLKQAGLPLTIRLTDIRHFRIIEDLKAGVQGDEVRAKYGWASSYSLSSYMGEAAKPQPEARPPKVSLEPPPTAPRLAPAEVDLDKASPPRPVSRFGRAQPLNSVTA